MYRSDRRTFLSRTLAGAAIVAAGTTLSPASSAVEDLQDVKFPKDPKAPQPGLETAHAPLVTVERVEAKSVAYGKTPSGEFQRVSVHTRHEETREHHILDIALYVNGLLAATHAINPARPEAALPTANFVLRLSPGDELLAVTNCNLHGKWGTRVTV